MAINIETWSGKTIALVVEYARDDWSSNMRYHVCERIGPRAGIKPIYSSLY